MHVCEGTPSPNLSPPNLFLCLLINEVVIVEILIAIVVTSTSLLR